MSTNFAEEYSEDVTSLDDFSEESWEEALRPPKEEQHHSKSRVRRLSRRSGREVPLKKYRLVYNRQADSVRLEPEQAQTAHTQVTLDEAVTIAINASRSILALGDNWDEEGSPGYTESTWIRATEFIKETTISYWIANKIWVTPPRILPGPEGSIDIHWRTPDRELLINIPVNEDTPAGYYGSGSPKDTIKGKLDTSLQNPWILAWLLQ